MKTKKKTGEEKEKTSEHDKKSVDRQPDGQTDRQREIGEVLEQNTYSIQTDRNKQTDKWTTDRGYFKQID